MKTIFVVLLILFGVNAFADTVVIGQKNKLFVVKDGSSDSAKSEISVKKGDTVRFINDDEFFHNVFSLSDAKLFDLGSFPKGEFRDVIFDTPGMVEVECAIHPEMKININVE